MNEIGLKLRYARELKGFSQEYLGEKLGYKGDKTKAIIVKFEAGEKTPKETEFTALLELLGINIDYLFAPTVYPTTNLMSILLALDELNTFSFQEKTYTNEHGQEVTEKALHIPLLNPHFKEWSEKKEQLKNGKISLDEYHQWRIGWSSRKDGFGG